ncbi:MAG: ABC transporter ATP-binding protein [Pelagibacterales bacterium]|nr:ABC transporter ATP-binding protein [Pelagibacterales bacterium]
MYNLSEKKLYKPFSNDLEKVEVISYLKKILIQESSLITIAATYGVIIALLSLAVPISVQFLINSVSFTATTQPIIFLGITLFLFLGFWSLLNILRFYVTEIFQRKFFARMTSEVGLSLLNAEYKTFETANQTEMVNRFFETTNIQKSIPKILTKTFAIALQTIAGLILVSFYHPIFLVFSLFAGTSVFLIWILYYKKALKSAFYESRRKYDIVGWLEDIARGHLSFKSKAGHDYAKYKINFLTGLYLEERKQHFKSLFSQTILLLALYVVSSISLLMIGGLLVLKGQLTIGQLAAAELVLSTSLYGISQFGKDFESFYDLIASCEKLSQFQNIPSDRKNGLKLPSENINIKFKDVFFRNNSNSYLLNIDITYNKSYAILSEGFSTKKLILDMMLGFTKPEQGSIQLNGVNLKDFDLYEYRSEISLIDNSPLIEASIKEYLTLGSETISDAEINNILTAVKLDEHILQLQDGILSRIIPSGWPFSQTEKILLKIARALLRKTEIIILTEVFDSIAPKIRNTVFEYINNHTQTTLIYFTNRENDLENFDQYIVIKNNSSKLFNSKEELLEFKEKSSENEQ